MANVEFSKNYQDLSSGSGYQFKFVCESCGNGYMSSWKANKTGIAGSLLRSVGGLLGGVMGRVASNSSDIERAVAGTAHDKALGEAVEEIKPLFLQCKRCGQWVCREICWNAERSLCKACAPILQRELAAKQAAITVEQAEQKLHAEDLTEGINLKATATVHCPACGAEAKGGKFCPSCGAALVPKTECSKCGAKISPSDKFCPECGNKMS